MAIDKHLRSIPSLKGRTSFDNRFEVAAQVLAAGTQDTAVRVVTPLSGPHKGQIAVRVGRILVYVANREALAAFVDAWNEAAGLAGQAGQRLAIGWWPASLERSRLAADRGKRAPTARQL